jgi:drug/metabolite transporter (DMT)-like permease
VIKSLFSFVARHERSLSAVSMVGGFAFDNYAFRRIDLPNTQVVFIAYLSVAAVSMLIMHVLAERVANGKEWPRWRAILPFATQFALGGLWSAFLVFYSRTAVLTASWPFIMVLLGIFLEYRRCEESPG